MNIFSIEERKRQRKKIVNYISRKIHNNLNYPQEKIGAILKSFHIIGHFYLMILCLFFSYKFAIYCLVFQLAVGILYIYFSGCLLTVIEYKLTNNFDLNITDPYLNILNIPINNINRRNITYKAILFFILYYIVIAYLKYSST